jgi:catechol 2,3-dioxygenase-like lactoylglutathione lyase family enzyme
MIDHLRLGVRSLAASRAFYETALAPLGFAVVLELGDRIAFGRSRRPVFFLAEVEPTQTGVHIAFQAEDRAHVDAFHAAALQAGGTDNGPPGPRPRYHPHYYGAFVLDPDGNNAEAVCHAPA